MSSCVFGPVPSRRLGRSLGIDLVPFKTCTYDCIYCQLGRTTRKTAEKKEWIPVEKVLRDIKEKLETMPDYITFSGSGEPTLYSKIGELILGIKEMTSVPVAVLTNGSMLSDIGVQESLMEADLVIPSLDAGDEDIFKYVNRPHESITFKSMIEGLKNFRSKYSGECWLEIFLLGGVTGITSEVEKIAAITRDIMPDWIQLNTVSRPPAEDFAYPVLQSKMMEFAKIFGENCEVISEDNDIFKETHYRVTLDNVLGMLERRPCTIKDISTGLGLHENEVVKYVQKLLTNGKLKCVKRKEHVYYEGIH